MGIASLLPQLRSITKKKSLEHYRGKTVAVDGYVLLHRGAYACARELVEGEPTDKYITYCLNRVELLLKHGIIPFIIFDGGPLPNKSDEESTRHQSREENRERAQNLWRQGNRVAALEAYQKAVDVTPEMAHCVILALKQRGVRFLVAPYEADAQMAYLALNGFVDAVITEDSDLLTYGCPVVLFKLDYGGEVDEISLADLPHCRELSFTGWTHDLFQQMCVMAGCDFLKGLPGIGIKKAHAQIRRTRDFKKALRALRFDGIQAPPGYELKFQRALWTFKHQRVYCPRRREIVPLAEPEGGSLAAKAAVPAAAELLDGEVDFLGPHLPVHIGQGIAEGRLHPVTFQPMQLATTHLRNNNSTRSIEAVFSFDRQLANGNTGAQQAAAMPPIAVSAEVRQQYKRPRIAGTGSDSADEAGSQHPQQQQLLKPKARPMRPRPPAAALTAQQYFPSSEGNPNSADGLQKSKPSSKPPLLSTLKAALRACDEPLSGEKKSGGEEEAAELAEEAEMEKLLDFGEFDELKPGLARLWAPLAWQHTPGGGRSRVHLPAGSLGSGPPPFSRDAGMDQSPAPWVTPGFYTAGGAGTLPDENGRNAGRGTGVNTSPEPLSLQFQGEEDVDEVDKAPFREPLVDLAHLPEAAIEAAAATKAAVEAASEHAAINTRKAAPRASPKQKKMAGDSLIEAGRDKKQTHIFGKFICK
jgi:exonuclease-1